MGRLDDHDYADEVSERIDAPAERVYDLVSDLPAMGRFSPENRGGRWPRIFELGGITRLGYRGIVTWSLWPGAAIMVSSGLLSFGLQWRTVVVSLATRR